LPWTLDDIPWHDLDRSAVEPELLRVVKAAALVEGRSGDYADYLCNVFAGDAEFQAQARAWGREEVQHGAALATWAERADPSFRYDEALRRFRDGYALPIDAEASIRGNLSAELVARCVVECGTSSFYSAIRDASAEPVLRAIAHRIAGDEFRHYQLFLKTLRRYREQQPLSLVRRLRVALGRIGEAGDDELAYAYHCANGEPGQAYDRRACGTAYEAAAARLYRPGHVARMVAMIAKAVDLDPQGWPVRQVQRLAWRILCWRRRRLEARLA
jgi:hypothetical protein